MLSCFSKENSAAIPVEIFSVTNFPSWLSTQNDFVKNWLQTTKFRNESGCFSLIPDTNGKLIKVIFCVCDKNNFWTPGSLPTLLPEGIYQFIAEASQQFHLALAWGLGAYQYSRYKKPKKSTPQLVISNKDAEKITSVLESLYLVRDLINAPTDDMGPTELANATIALGKNFYASVTQIIGDELLKQNFPSIHLVGRASDDAPRLIDLRWGDEKNPKVTLVGKGVCFDTGGLDLKPANNMLLMKKDMGGAAHVLGLARLIMQANLPIRLRVLIPAVENSVSANAYRPGDVVKTRKGLTVEIANTDAEGRVVLADALTEAVSESPELMIDIATLTGAARVALGTDLPALFSNDEILATKLLQHSNEQQDPMWRLPLFCGYRDALTSYIADLNNAPADGYAGAITAALFLKEFVPDTTSWAHIDLMAWNLKTRAGRPMGGEAMALRGIFSYLEERFGKRS